MVAVGTVATLGAGLLAAGVFGIEVGIDCCKRSYNQ